MNRRTCFQLALTLVFATAGEVIAAAPPAKVALVGGRIVPVVGDPIDKGTLLIENGKITAIGTDVEIPFDAMEVDVSGKVLFPGMIDPHSARGLDVANETLPVTPYLDVYDAIDPSRLYFEDSLRDGVTSVHVIVANNCVIGGLSRVVRPIGLSLDEMTVRPRIALKLATTPKGGFDRMVQMATLRETFLELADYLERLAEKRYEDTLKEEDKKIEVGPAEARKRGRKLLRDEDYDDKHANLVKLTTGKLDAWVYCGAATDVAPAIGTAKRNGFFERTVFVVGPQCVKAADELREAKRPVVLDPELVYRERDPITGKLTETFVPKVFADKGITFALQPNSDASLAERYLNYQAARCVRNGIPRQTALEAITLNPARMLGLGDKLGSLEVGKTANVLVLSGDPLSFDSWVEKSYIDGILAYDRTKDARLEELLLDRIQPAPTSQPATQPEADEKDDDEKDDEEKNEEEKADEKKKAEAREDKQDI